MRIYSEEEITRLYRVRRTVLEMLKDRGYFVTDEEIKMTREQFKENFGGENLRRDHLEITTYKINDDAKKHMKGENPDFKPEKICVVFSNDVKNTGVKEVKSVISRMKAEDVSKGILIIQTKVSSYAKTFVNEGRGTLEVFEEAELLVNITKHDLVPKHELLTPEQKKAVLEEYTVKEFQLPRILKSDPVARYYGLQRGQVVKITRKSETAGEYITYRYVVDK